MAVAGRIGTAFRLHAFVTRLAMQTFSLDCLPALARTILAACGGKTLALAASLRAVANWWTKSVPVEFMKQH